MKVTILLVVVGVAVLIGLLMFILYEGECVVDHVFVVI